MATPSFAFLDILAQTKNLPTSHNFYPTSPQSWWLCLQNRSRICPLLPILPTAAQVPHLTTIYFAQSNQVMLSKHVRSHYFSAQNPHVFPVSFLKPLKWPTWSGSLLPQWPPNHCLPMLHSSHIHLLAFFEHAKHTPALGFLHKLFPLSGNFSQRDSHSFLLPISAQMPPGHTI